MPLARVEFAQMGEGVEVAKEGFGDGGEVITGTDVIDVGDQLATDAIDGGVSGTHEAAGFEQFQVPCELFSVEGREGLPSVWVQSASATRETVESTVVQFEGGCQEM
jgi:hypothetical protein